MLFLIFLLHLPSFFYYRLQREEEEYVKKKKIEKESGEGKFS